MQDSDSSGRYDLLKGVAVAFAITIIAVLIVIGVVNLFNGLAN